MRLLIFYGNMTVSKISVLKLLYRYANVSITGGIKQIAENLYSTLTLKKTKPVFICLHMHRKGS